MTVILATDPPLPDGFQAEAELTVQGKPQAGAYGSHVIDGAIHVTLPDYLDPGPATLDVSYSIDGFEADCPCPQAASCIVTLMASRALTVDVSSSTTPAQ